jgi:hypothetical protein
VCAVAVAAAVAAFGAGAGPAAAPGSAHVWFAPLPPLPTSAGRPYVGGPDFMRLFAKRAPWASAAKRVAVFKLYGEWVDGNASAAQLKRVVGELRRRKIALALETGPLDPAAECGSGVESFATVEAGVRMARRIKAAGGTLRFVALDEPLFYGSRYAGPNACRWDAERVARGVAAFTAAVRHVFPRVAVGDTEPVTSAADARAYVEWLDVYRAVSGESLAFIHLDMSYSIPGWEGLARSVEDAANARGVRFGLIVFGEPGDASDAAWIARARERIERYEVDAGGTPDHVLFQSWQDRPNRTLPDSDPSTFTGLVRSYGRPRTVLTLVGGPPDPAGTLVADGRLATQAGKPVGGMRVELVAVLPVLGLEPLALTSTAVTTDTDGRFQARLTGVPASGHEIRARYGGSASLWPGAASLGAGAPLANLARGRPVSAPAALPSNPPAFAVDCDPQSTWIAGTGPPLWLEIDLGAPSRVVAVRLRVAHTPDGPTAHRVLALTGSGWVTLADLAATTIDGQVLTVRPPAPVDGVRAVRVETTQSPSWVAWREVEVLGAA